MSAATVVINTNEAPRMADTNRQPRGLRWRSSVWFITLVVALGLTCDLLVYSLIVPIMPFQLENLGYNGVSGLVGWLLFAYSAGIVAFTPPIAYLSERYNSRKIPLLCGQVALIGAQIMLMLAPTYWLMVIARLLQGLSSSVIWVAGLALLCDTVPEKSVGRQLGIAMSGLSIGYLVGPPVSGALFNAFGFHGPFIFGIIATAVDLVGRLLIIERSHALLWCIDPTASSEPDIGKLEADEKAAKTEINLATSISSPEPEKQEGGGEEVLSTADTSVAATECRQLDGTATASATEAVNQQTRISLVRVLGKLLTSSRAWAVCISTLIYGMILTSQEPALPLHLQAVWHFNASKVGIVYIAAVVPTLFSSTLAGWWVDKKGTGAITVVSLLFALPWLGLLIIQKSIALFIVVFALSNFAISGIVSAITAELATVCRQLDGVGYAHVYGAFNLSYGVGSGRPIIGGQLYDHLRRGWMAIILFGLGLCVVAILLAFFYFGDDPLAAHFIRRFGRKGGTHSATLH